MNGPLRAVPRRLKSGTAKTVPAVPAAPALLIKRNVAGVLRNLGTKAAARAALLYYVGGIVALRIMCAAWCSLQPAGIGATLSGKVEPCPSTIEIALCDNGFVPEDRTVSSTFHPGTKGCFRQKIEREGYVSIYC